MKKVKEIWKEIKQKTVPHRSPYNPINDNHLNTSILYSVHSNHTQISESFPYTSLYLYNLVGRRILSIATFNFDLLF